MAHTSVSMANGIFQLSGGTILAMPYFCASSRMLLMYWTGSLNCSVVGRYVGASCRPNMRFGFGGWLLGAPWCLRSTVARSSGCALRALRGMGTMPFDCAPVTTGGIAIPPILDLDAGDAPSCDPISPATRKVVIVAPVDGPPWGMKSTMTPSPLHPAPQSSRPLQ
jgi:hypothetical protein